MYNFFKPKIVRIYSKEIRNSKGPIPSENNPTGDSKFSKKFGFDEKSETGLFNKSSSLAAAFSVTNLS